MEQNRAFVSGEIREFDRKVAEETRTVEFVISDETRDRHGTVIPLAAWQLDQYNKNGIVGYQHNVYGGGFLTDPNPDSVLGVGRAFVDGDKLIGEVRFEPAEINPLAEKIFQKVLHGTLKAVSVGFREIEKGKWGEKERGEDIAGKNATYYFGKVELLEFSIVNIPSNPNALRREVETDIENRTRELTEECERLGAQIIAQGAQIDTLKRINDEQTRLIEYYKHKSGLRG